MKKCYFVFIIISISFILVACNEQTIDKTKDVHYIGNLTPNDILTNNKDADIFMLNGVVYRIAEDIEWVNEQQWTLGEEVGEIMYQTNDSSEFDNYTATKLAVGTKIYESVEKGDIYIVIVDNKEIRYLGLREG